MADELGAVIIYGRGGELGDFRVFAQTLKNELQATFGPRIDMQNIQRKKGFFDLVKKPNLASKIKELHVFSHSIGAGLFLAYKETVVQVGRQQVFDRAASMNKQVTYEDVLGAEIGAVLTDDFLTADVQSDKTLVRANFAGDAIIKIWGCNSGIDSWVYSDGGVVDPSSGSAPYYWRALNEKNMPKPSIAQACADYFGLKVFGAKSGANIEVKDKSGWISSKAYKDKVGHWPSGILPYRLVPAKGEYVEFTPK